MLRNVLIFGIVGAAGISHAFGVFGTSTLVDAVRWDAGPRSVGGVERSLSGGIRYSVQGGSWQAYRDSFSWSSLPTVAAFQTAVENAFGEWQKVDPVSNLGSTLNFGADFATTTTGLVHTGAEIDLLSESVFGAGVMGGTSTIGWLNGQTVTLTSGVAGYTSKAAIGSDIRMNNNNVAWSLDIFETVLTHEIGHSLGLTDVEGASASGTFIDDNYNGSSAANAQATLTNSFAHLINPLDPAASPLNLYALGGGSLGLSNANVDILMESSISNFFITADPRLQNDDFAGRQFLYPVNPVPEPATMIALGSGALMLLRRRRSKK